MTTTAASQFTRDDQPAGCMIATAATQCAPNQARLRDLLTTRRTEAEAALVTRLRAGITSGDLPAEADIEATAAFYSVLLRGMSLLARGGAPRERLLTIADIGLHAWPAPPQSGSIS
ncbi:TetR family transcriptional regulator C-terminal domain-containing protein [Gluconacetobacter sp.]|uniref:TetR family transcriptional regulator C-terminal domain-containing protein n=1 Tax=Gluconacetobacter sp. TaxID=1935994 RepID=UPI0039EC0153